MLAERYCYVEECSRLAGPNTGGVCWAHEKQRLRGQPWRPITPRHASPWARLAEAALTYADADAEDDTAFEAAGQRLRSAAIRYVTALPAVVGDRRTPRPHRARRRRDDRQGSLFG